jgi:phosphoribosylaminoimidazole-succinocarboxamide synthase
MTTATDALYRTDLGLSGRQGKVRDVYHLPAARAGEAARTLIVASDRISAFDVVLPLPIPGKGRLLTEIATFWLRWIEDRGLSATHLISTDVGDIPDAAFKPGGSTREMLDGRITIGTRCEVIPIEFVVRGYVEGSGWKDYQATGTICGIELPKGLRRCDKLPRAVFTPATKAPQGEHDENVSIEEAGERVGRELMADLRDRSLSIYTAAAAFALERGIIIADTKFEFGFPVDESGRRVSDEAILIDEALTPDSSRFWPADDYEPGRAQASFDKQFVRDYLQELVDDGKWDKTAPGPELPEDVIANTLAKYREAVERLRG